MTNRKFYTLSLRAGSAGPFASRLEATAALNALIEQGYADLDSSDIEEYAEDKDYRGVELLAEQRNNLIDFCG